jgi:hypothetical protein
VTFDYLPRALICAGSRNYVISPSADQRLCRIDALFSTKRNETSSVLGPPITAEAALA